ncbi:DUF5133 domain-containing protein [Streptomyces sp. HMX87]
MPVMRAVRRRQRTEDVAHTLCVSTDTRNRDAA